jgi:hypothetical protein
MAQEPILIFDKSTIQTLTVDGSVLLDNFYMSNITPVLFAECLAVLHPYSVDQYLLRACAPDQSSEQGEAQPQDRLSLSLLFALLHRIHFAR